MVYQCLRCQHKKPTELRNGSRPDNKYKTYQNLERQVKASPIVQLRPPRGSHKQLCLSCLTALAAWLRNKDGTLAT
jgi:hypothetical protein